MPMVYSRDLDSVPTPLQGLFPKIRSVLREIAPERDSEYRALFEKLEWQFEMDIREGDFGFEAVTKQNPTQNVINIPLAALERLWAYVYSYLLLFDEVLNNPGIEITPERSPQVRGAFDLLNWAAHGEKEKKRFEWPAHLPRPNSDQIDPQRLEKTNRMFLGVLGFILLHEVAHLDKEHTLTKHAPAGERMSDEECADRWAAKWLLDRCGDYSSNPDYRIQRCCYVTLALSILNLVEFSLRYGPPKSHPPTLERILKFSKDFCPESSTKSATIADFPLHLARVILEFQASNLEVGTRSQSLDTITEELRDLFKRFEQSYQP